jgi:hypothetical protein
LLNYFLSEEYDTLFNSLPYLLERIVVTAMQGILKSIQMICSKNPSSSTRAGVNTANLSTKSNFSSSVATSPTNRNQHLKALSNTNSPVAISHENSTKMNNNNNNSSTGGQKNIPNLIFQQYWNLLKLIRDLPNEFLLNIAHVLNTGLFMILKSINQAGLELSLEQLYNLFSVLSVSLLLSPSSSLSSSGGMMNIAPAEGENASSRRRNSSTENRGPTEEFLANAFSKDPRIDELLSYEYQLFHYQQSRILIWKSLTYLIFTPGILNYSNFHLMKHLLMKFVQRLDFLI